jgi:hypothetical protein
LGYLRKNTKKMVTNNWRHSLTDGLIKIFWSDKIPINKIKNEKNNKRLLSFKKKKDDIYKNIPPDKGILLFFVKLENFLCRSLLMESSIKLFLIKKKFITIKKEIKNKK